MIGLSKMHCFIDGFLLDIFFLFESLLGSRWNTFDVNANASYNVIWTQTSLLLIMSSLVFEMEGHLFCRHTWWLLLLFSCFFLFDWRVPFLGYYYNFLLIYSYNCTFCVCSICLSFMPSKVPGIYFIGLFLLDFHDLA